MINFATSAAGFIKVEIQAADGQALPGYSLKESRVLIGNEMNLERQERREQTCWQACSPAVRK